MILGDIVSKLETFVEICPGLNTNEIQIPYGKHHKVSSLIKRHLNTHNSIKYEVQ